METAEQVRGRIIVLLAAAVLALWMLAPAAHAAAAQSISTDPYSSAQTGAQDASEVEPFAASSGNTIVGVFQVGRYNTLNGGAADIGWATSSDGGQTWGHGFMPSVTVNSSPAGSYGRAVDPGVAYDAVHGTWLGWSVVMAQTTSGGSYLNAAMVVNRSSDGRNWSAPVVIRSVETPDKDWIACDNWVSSPHEGTCYAVWTAQSATPNSRYRDQSLD